MKTRLLMQCVALLVVCFAGVSGAQAHDTLKNAHGTAVYLNAGYVVPAPCPYPYGCNANGYPYAPPPLPRSYDTYSPYSTYSAAYVVPAPCAYPYGCDAYGYPNPPPYGLRPGNGSMLGMVAGLVGNLVISIRH